MLEALFMAVQSALIGFFLAERVCIPFVGFQGSTEKSIVLDHIFRLNFIYNFSYDFRGHLQLRLGYNVI